MMIERFRQRYPVLVQRSTLLGIVATTSVVAISVWVLGIPSFPDWTGLNGKTLWDLLNLLAVLALPIVLTVFGVWFTRTENERQHKLAEESREQERRLAYESQAQERALADRAREEERRLALDSQQERALQDYMDRMTELLLEKGLRESEEGSEVRAVAHARTHAVLRRLDPQRRTSVMRFLLDAKLVGGKTPIIGLRKANLQGVDLEGVDLSETNLRFVNLSEANIVRANLQGADLQGACLNESVLEETNFKEAVLAGVSFAKARLLQIDLQGADLFACNFNEASLRKVNLDGANLHMAKARNADFVLVSLTGARLSSDFPGY